jgi:hypothetical protein
MTCNCKEAFGPIHGYILIYVVSYYFILAERGGFEPPLGCLFPKTV